MSRVARFVISLSLAASLSGTACKDPNPTFVFDAAADGPDAADAKSETDTSRDAGGDAGDDGGGGS
jgi:hypothetical protein